MGSKETGNFLWRYDAKPSFSSALGQSSLILLRGRSKTPCIRVHGCRLSSKPSTRLAKLGPVGDKTHVSTRAMGALGYCAPEYHKTGRLTVKSDIYSYGVVLLELITGRRVIDLTRKNAELHLVRWEETRIKDPHKYSELVDPLLDGKLPTGQFKPSVSHSSHVSEYVCIAPPIDQ